jgi:nickel-type superoxide dismutase maturation protease
MHSVFYTFLITFNVIFPGYGFYQTNQVRLAILFGASFLALVFVWMQCRWIFTPVQLGLFIALFLTFQTTNTIQLVISLRQRDRTGKLDIGSYFHATFFIGLYALAGVYWQAVLQIHWLFIPTPSMSPAIMPNDIMIADTSTQATKSIEPGDIIVFEHPKQRETKLVKRVISISANQAYKVEGDNAFRSIDSRWFGAIKQEDIIGVVKIRIGSWENDRFVLSYKDLTQKER